MGSGVSSEKTKDAMVVIIGAGYGGTEVAVALRKNKVPFKLIDKNDYFHHCSGALRATVFPDYGPRTVIPLKEAFGDNFLQAEVVGLDFESNTVTLGNQETVNFTHCVIAVGSVGPEPARYNAKTTREDVLKEYQLINNELAKAKKIVIVGGGPVGIELAGEIRDKYKDPEVTVVHSNPSLVSEKFETKFQNNLRDFLRMQNVQLVEGRAENLNDLEVNVIKEQVVKVKDQELQADLVFRCVGLPPNVEVIKKLVPGDKMDANGRIKVDEYLRVEGMENIFAIGDCCNTDEDKMAAHAGVHGTNVATNITNTLMNRKLKKYKQAFTGMIIPVGKSLGTGVMNGYTLPCFAAVMLKSHDLFTTKYWGGMGLKDPGWEKVKKEAIESLVEKAEKMNSDQRSASK